MSSDEMPCGCLGHANYEHLCRYPAREAETKSLREQVRTLTAERDEARDGATRYRLKANAAEAGESLAQTVLVETRKGLESMRSKLLAAETRAGSYAIAAGDADALHARVAELEKSLDDAGVVLGQVIALRSVDTTYGEVPVGLVEHAAVNAMLQTMRERDTARDAALEEAAQVLDVAPYSNDEEGSLLATQAGAIRALKAQPSRRFVEAEKAEAERRDAWIHGIETAAGIVAERGDDVQAASVVYDVLKARVEFERSHGTEVKP